MIKNSIGMIIPIINSIPPLPIRPLLPLTIANPVIVIIIRDMANISENMLHHLFGL